jgi:hypothetical protein
LNAADELERSRLVRADISFRYDVEPPWVDPRSGEDRMFPAVCAPKPAGLVELTLNMADLGFPQFRFGIRCRGERVGAPAADGSQNILWRVDPSPVNFRTTLDGREITVEHAEGQFTTRVALLALEEDDPDPPCADGPWRHIVSLETVSAPLPNEVVLRIVALGVLPVWAWAHNLVVRGTAGLLQTIPTPRLHVTRFVAADEGPVCIASAQQRFDFDVVLSGTVRLAQAPSGALPVEVRAGVWAIDPEAPTPPIAIVPAPPVQVRIGSDRGRFALLIPPDFWGSITLSGRVDAADPYTYGSLWVSPEQNICVLSRIIRWSEGWEKLLAWRPFPDCPACLLRGFNDRGDVIGTREGAPFRLLAHGQPEYLGDLLPSTASVEAVNALGHVAGGTTDETGRRRGFIVGDTIEKTVIVEDAWLLALNDDGVAAGYQSVDGRAVALLVKDGKPTALNIQGDHSIATAINNAGDVAGVVIDKDRTRPFLKTAEGVRLLRGLDPRAAVVTALNDHGIAVGGSRTKDGAWHAVMYAPKKKDVTDLGVTDGFDKSHANDINVAGIVVGTLSGNDLDARSHGFVYSEQLGLRNLNKLIGNPDVVIYDAIKVNNRGEIIAFGQTQEGTGYFVIRPESSAPAPVGTGTRALAARD